MSAYLLQLVTVQVMLLVSLSISATAQQISLAGTVSDEQGVPVPLANVLIKQRKNEKLLYFKATDNNGAFVLNLPSETILTYFYLEVTHVSYRTIKIELEKGKNFYEIRLSRQRVHLDEVSVGIKPRINASGDTIRYDVNSFATQLDRSVGDALKRMPGFEVEQNGRILYQGQAISHLYIDGDDLLEGKYGIGTRAIPHAIVQGVEVYKNHQDIKVLQDRVVSRDITINLVIADKAKMRLNGEAKLGGGWPEQYVSELNAIVFNDKIKMLDALKGNNAGIDIREDLQDLTGQAATNLERHSQPLLSSGTAGAPNLPKARHYLNNSVGLFAHHLVTLDADWQVRANIDLFADRNKLIYDNQNMIFGEMDSISFTEQLYRVNKPFLTEGSLRVHKNTKKTYLNNLLKFNYSRDYSAAELSGDEQLIDQRLKQQQWFFDNHFQYFPMLKGKDVLKFSGRVATNKAPEQLVLASPQKPIVDVPSMSLSWLRQRVTTRTTHAELNIEYLLKPTWFSHRYNLQAFSEWQSLHSSLNPIEGEQVLDEITTGNALQWRRSYALLGSTYEIKRSNFTLSATLPLRLQQISYDDAQFALNRGQVDWLFDPSLEISKKIGQQHEVAGHYGYSNTFGNMQNIYQGAIMTNYRTLLANDTVLQRNRGHHAGFAVKLANAPDMLFVNLGYDYAHVASNVMMSYQVTEQLTSVVALPLTNRQTQHNAVAGISKFLFFLGVKSGITAKWSLTNDNQLVNDALLPYRNRMFSLSPDLNAKLLGRINVAYIGNWSWLHNEPRQRGLPFSQRLVTFSQSVQLYYSPSAMLDIGLKGQQLYTKQREQANYNYFFMDANARYKIPTWRIVLEFDLFNIANIKTFEYIALTTNSRHNNRYQIRGRMALVKAAFTF